MLLVAGIRMGNISEQIDEIITKRKVQLKYIESAREAADAVLENMYIFKDFQNEIRDNLETFPVIEGGFDVAGSIESIPTEEFFNLHKDYVSELERFIKRLNRDNLNISFIGRTGQGKSLAMQNISGLDSSVIPSSNRGDCTGAKSIITNSESGPVSAIIQFYQKDEMVDIVNQYLLKLTDGRRFIKDVSDIPAIKTKELRKTLYKRKNETVKEEDWLDHLCKYVEHYADYIDDLGTTKEVTEEEIEYYIAQYSSMDAEKKYYKYLGVKLANISTPFLNRDAGKIVLVDTVGIGATSLGIEEEMLKAVENDSDAIIFMFRPDNKRGKISDNEISIIRNIAERISPEYTKEMLFWVINRVETGDSGDNVHQASDVIQTIRQRNYPIADVFNVNCSSEDEVQNRLLIPVLKQLSSRIQDADKLLLDKLNTKGEHLFQMYSQICQATDRAFASSANEDLKRKFYRKINPTIKKGLLNELRKLYLDDYNNLRHMPCEELMNAASGKFKNIIKSVPTKEMVMDLLSYGDANQFNAYEACTNIMRMQIIDDFTELNNVLYTIVERMKKQVLHIFTDDDKGKLGLVYPLGDSSDEWIDGFLNLVEGEKKYPFLSDALRKFQSYTINVQGFLIHEIREQLDPIDISLPRPDGSSSVPQISGSMAQPELVAEEIVEWLKTYAEDVHDNVEITLQDVYKTPNRSMFAAIKDLYDRITYTMADNESKIAEEWRYLYEDWMHLIWKDEYQQQSAVKVIADEWNDVVSKLKEINKPEYFIIRN